MTRIVAQVAVEAIVNNPDGGWEFTTAMAVLETGREYGVSDIYLSMLEDIIANGF